LESRSKSKKFFINLSIIGYSISGFGDLNEVTDEEFERATNDEPAQLEKAPEPDETQKFIDSLPDGHEDKMYEQIDAWARQSYARHKCSVRGQQVTRSDSMDSHIIWATLRWAEEHKAAPPFTSLPNPDLDVIKEAFEHAANNLGSVNMIKLASAIAALKRLKGDV